MLITSSCMEYQLLFSAGLKFQLVARNLEALCITPATPQLWSGRPRGLSRRRQPVLNTPHYHRYVSCRGC